MHLNDDTWQVHYPGRPNTWLWSSPNSMSLCLCVTSSASNYHFTNIIFTFCSWHEICGLQECCYFQVIIFFCFKLLNWSLRESKANLILCQYVKLDTDYENYEGETLVSLAMIHITFKYKVFSFDKGMCPEMVILGFSRSVVHFDQMWFD